MTEHPSPQPNNTVFNLLRSFQSRDGEVTADLWNRFFPRLVRVAHGALANLPHRAEDARDAAQAALITLWKRIDRDGLTEMLDGNSLWKLLATIAIRKAIQGLRRESAEKRGGGKVVAFTDAVGPADTVSNLLAFVPTADFDVECADRLQQLPDELQQIAVLKLFGYTTAEVAAMLACTERWVQRRLNLIEQHLSDQQIH